MAKNISVGDQEWQELQDLAKETSKTIGTPISLPAMLRIILRHYKETAHD